jgi:hypothetical protein
LLCGVVIGTGAVILAGCAGDSQSSRLSRDDSTKTATSLGPGKESDYVGLSKSAAIAKAKDQGRPSRIGREDGEMFLGTLDYNPERVTFEIDDGKVTKATFG